MPQRYRYVSVPRDHPLARVNTRTSEARAAIYEHRLVLWDRLGPGVHACHWCGREVEWNVDDRRRRLEADHVNGDGVDNRPENLVPSCHPCNVHRPGVHPVPRVDDDESYIERVAADGSVKRVRAVRRICARCATEFLIPPAALRAKPGRAQRGIYCSRDCMYARGERPSDQGHP